MYCYHCGRIAEDEATEHPNGNIVLKCLTCGHSLAYINGKMVFANPQDTIILIQKVNVE